eukprot:tig00021435_g21430.t1
MGVRITLADRESAGGSARALAEDFEWDALQLRTVKADHVESLALAVERGGVRLADGAALDVQLELAALFPFRGIHSTPDAFDGKPLRRAMKQLVEACLARGRVRSFTADLPCDAIESVDGRAACSLSGLMKAVLLDALSALRRRSSSGGGGGGGGGRALTRLWITCSAARQECGWMPEGDALASALAGGEQLEHLSLAPLGLLQRKHALRLAAAIPGIRRVAVKAFDQSDLRALGSLASLEELVLCRRFLVGVSGCFSGEVLADLAASPAGRTLRSITFQHLRDAAHCTGDALRALALFPSLHEFDAGVDFETVRGHSSLKFDAHAYARRAKSTWPSSATRRRCDVHKPPSVEEAEGLADLTRALASSSSSPRPGALEGAQLQGGCS